MICPNCGEITHRSHSRNFRESFVKSVAPYKTYRCRECGWRGMARLKIDKDPVLRLRTIAVWIVGLLFAVAVGILGANILR
ncbi:MAG: hypothetical protein ACREBD_08535 [Blastocatellia bacterium]